MLGRRVFANCALCAITAAAGLIGGTQDAAAQAGPTGISRKMLGTTEMPGGKLICVEALSEVAAGALVARHTHPGVESGYFLEGGGVLSVKGQPDRTMKEGDAYQVPTEVPHAFQNAGKKTRLIATFTVQKDKPMASPA